MDINNGSPNEDLIGGRDGAIEWSVCTWLVIIDIGRGVVVFGDTPNNFLDNLGAIACYHLDLGDIRKLTGLSYSLCSRYNEMEPLDQVRRKEKLEN